MARLQKALATLKLLMVGGLPAMITQVIEKQDGMGPYFFTLHYLNPFANNERYTLVFSDWDDLVSRRSQLEGNGIETTWELSVDYTRKTRVCHGAMDSETMLPDYKRAS